MKLSSASSLALLALVLVVGSSHGMGINIISNTGTTKSEGGFITLTCNIPDVNGVTSVRWTKAGGPLPTNHYIFPPLPHTNNHLLLYNLQASDSGLYTCSVARTGGTAAAASYVTVISPEPPVTPCLSDPCRNGGTCMDIPQLNTFACLCHSGYRGVNCENAVAPPTTQPPPTTTPFVTVADPCASGPCQHGGLCSSQGGDEFQCLCSGSYTGPTCEIFDNCATSPCMNGGVCMNIASSNGSSTCSGSAQQFTCACTNGFTGSTCGKRDFCSSSPCFNGATCVNVDAETYDCVCMDGYVGSRCERMPFEGCGKYGQPMRPRELRDFFYTETIRSSPPAADIVFVVDESGSMVTEHRWLHEVSTALDAALQNTRIGVDMPNQFGLVGFARDNKMDVTGRIIHMDNGCKFGQASQFKKATSRLALNGRLEDLYLGIIMALDHYEFRPGAACQIIGVTDEGRYPLVPSANHLDASRVPYEYEYMLKRLNASGCVLNVVVNQQMESDGKPGLGVGSKGEGYAEMPGGNYRVDPKKGRAVAQSGHGSTHKDYTRLALSTHGGSWDLNRLRQGGDVAMAFTKAFVHLKQREISRQLCERCTCEQGPEPTCRAGCLGEPPAEVSVVSVYDKLSEPAVNEGGSALFQCNAVGDPMPTCSWTKADGSPLPSGARKLGENNCTLMVPGVSSINCVQCHAENIEGRTESSVQCVDYAAACEMADGRKVFHGSSAREYSESKVEDLHTIPFSSAIVVMVVDESRSMIGEHRWLKSTLPAMEKNLLERGVGTGDRSNQYALVGFASPRYNRLGRIVNVAPGRDCGSADETSAALASLRQDGRKEDGYAAIEMALDRLSCLQGSRANATALQVILVTDEDRDVLKKSATYESVRLAIVRRGGLLNVVVKNQFHGKDADMRSVRAMGIDRRQRAVIVAPGNKEGFYFLPHGMSTKDSGHGTTSTDYVDLATHTGGGAWDLTMLRDDSYRESFTRGFIAAKVEEIQVQLLGRCQECLCRNGTTSCTLLPTVKTEEGCMNPVPNAEIRVSILGEASAVAGDFSKLECVAEGPTDQGQPAVIWDPHPVSAMQVNNEEIRKHDLEFAATLEQDARPYRCVSRNEFGQAAASVEFNVAPSATNPFQGVVFGSSSGVNARFTEAGFRPVEEDRGENSICLHTTHTRRNRIQRFHRVNDAKALRDLEIRCEGKHSDVEFGKAVSVQKNALVQYGFGLPDGVYRGNGNFLKFNVAALKYGEFEVSCRHRGSQQPANCHQGRCLKVLVRPDQVLVLPKRKVCRFS